MTSVFPPSLMFTLGLALFIRIIWVLLIPVDPISDSAAYAVFATNIADHGVYGFKPDAPGAYWAVGTAAIYAGAYILFGTGSSVGVVVVNLISALVVVWLLYDLGRRWYNEYVGRLAALIFAIWPMTIQFTTVLASEIHFMALTLAALACWDRAKWGPRGMGFLILSGVFFAGATYVRPIAMLIPAALAIAVLLRTPFVFPRAIFQAAVTTALIFALVAPWSARNERVLGEPVFMSTNFWPNFWMGNHADTSGEYTPLPAETEDMSEIERSKYLRALALTQVREDPAGFLLRTLGKAAKLHERETIGVVWNEASIATRAGVAGVSALKVSSTAWWYAVLAAALAGIALLFRRQGLWATLLCTPIWIWGYFTGVHAVVVVGDRYHMPAIPMIAILASVAISSALSHVKGLASPELRRSAGQMSPTNELRQDC